MPGGDDRVEPKTSLIGRGNGATPEHITELERRSREVEQTSRPQPQRSFAKVLAQRGNQEKTDNEPVSAKQKRWQALPKKGPRPSLLHPAQRDAYGRSESETEPVVIKG